MDLNSRALSESPAAASSFDLTSSFISTSSSFSGDTRPSSCSSTSLYSFFTVSFDTSVFCFGSDFVDVGLDLVEKANFDCCGGGLSPFGLPKNLLQRAQRLFGVLGGQGRGSAYPRVICLGFTYPKVACFGAMVLNNAAPASSCGKLEKYRTDAGRTDFAALRGVNRERCKSREDVSACALRNNGMAR